MKLVVIGCGRVGSAVALDLADDGVGLRDPGLLEHDQVHAVADDEAAAPLAESRERPLVLVDAGDVPALCGEVRCD